MVKLVSGRRERVSNWYIFDRENWLTLSQIRDWICHHICLKITRSNEKEYVFLEYWNKVSLMLWITDTTQCGNQSRRHRDRPGRKFVCIGPRRKFKIQFSKVLKKKCIGHSRSITTGWKHLKISKVGWIWCNDGIIPVSSIASPFENKNGGRDSEVALRAPTYQDMKKCYRI